ncbi:MAG: DNA helicase PcrA [Armatimonadetes bacterium]|nr:DNA helicase PcrA [Armatimonadota bacterium]
MSEHADSPVLAGLNDRQREAVLHTDGPLLIFAGAGSGKTRVLTHRAAYLIQERGVPARQILAVTFTNKAANEMKQRLRNLLGRGHWEMWVGTFHSTCARILRDEGERVGIPTDFVVFDESDQSALIKDCLRDLDLDPEQFVPSRILNEISNAKNELIQPREYFNWRGGRPYDEIVARVYALYQHRLSDNHACDFDDLIDYVVWLFEQHPDVLQRYQERFHYFLVDEYQDINFAQYRFIVQLASQRRNLCVVGDDDQAIYGWRGADMRIIMRFDEDYPDARVIKLEQNYRSTGNVLRAAWEVIRRNRTRREKQLWTDSAEGEKLVTHRAADEHAEATFIADTIEHLVQQEDRKHSDFAVLYRVNAQSRVFEQVFVSRGLPYRIVGGLRFYDREEVKDILAYLRLLHNPNDSVSLKRIINKPTRGIGDTTLAHLERTALERNMPIIEAARHADEIPELTARAQTAVLSFLRVIEGVRKMMADASVTELTEAIIEQSGYRQALEQEKSIKARGKLENIQELLTATQEYESGAEEPSVADFLENVALLTSADMLEAGVEAVPLMTLHSAKGLEFPVVFLVGMEEALFPLARAAFSDNPLELEEERRLCYVGMTRAEERLFLTSAEYRTIYGSTSRTMPSRFLDDIPDDLVEPMGPITPRNITWESADATRSPAAQAILEEAGAEQPFRAGDKVKHPTFGRGMVVSVNGTGEDTIISVAFPAKGIKKLDPEYAHLEKL